MRFSVKPTQEQINRKARDNRVEEHLNSPVSKATNQDIYQLLRDVADRQKDILRMLNK